MSLLHDGGIQNMNLQCHLDQKFLDPLDLPRVETLYLWLDYLQQTGVQMPESWEFLDMSVFFPQGDAGSGGPKEPPE